MFEMDTTMLEINNKIYQLKFDIEALTTCTLTEMLLDDPAGGFGVENRFVRQISGLPILYEN